jgi:nitrite reductase/ring-hydroxylating ferredoxin subunit
MMMSAIWSWYRNLDSAKASLPGGIQLFLALAIMLLSLSGCFTREGGTSLHVGEKMDFPPGSVTSVELPAAFIDPDPPATGSETPGVITQPASASVSPVPVFIVSGPEDVLLALYARDPFRGCRIKWSEEDKRFRDPCHGSIYTLTGEWLAGPSPRSMDRFEIIVEANEEVYVEVSRFHMGEPHP